MHLVPVTVEGDKVISARVARASIGVIHTRRLLVPTFRRIVAQLPHRFEERCARRHGPQVLVVVQQFLERAADPFARIDGDTTQQAGRVQHRIGPAEIRLAVRGEQGGFVGEWHEIEYAAPVGRRLLALERGIEQAKPWLMRGHIPRERERGQGGQRAKCRTRAVGRDHRRPLLATRPIPPRWWLQGRAQHARRHRTALRLWPKQRLPTVVAKLGVHSTAAAHAGKDSGGEHVDGRRCVPRILQHSLRLPVPDARLLRH
mmetsp:Transcript_19988/g.63590  ORF Transcript_19988/g.63590 Transcript_19988/m.63590 type:complete len:259 (-) Transcript_19988:178-954(-)